MSKYVATTNQNYKIIKTTTLYSDGKTQVPKEIIEKLQLERGSTMVWMEKDKKIYITNDKTQNMEF